MISSKNNKKILLVEDDSILASLYKSILKMKGYEVILAFDGENALSLLNSMEIKPILILLDLLLPKINGFDVLKDIKKTSILKNIPVVILTNLSERKDAERTLEFGAVLYLIKSRYTPMEIVEKVEEILFAACKEEKCLPKVKIITKDIINSKKVILF
ncbi:response regulator [Patescibacteria group bacterium]